MSFNRQNYSNQQLLTLYRQLLWPRMIEEKMLILLRQGKISKWFSGIGQEAIAVGATSALEPDEWIMPLHRNLGVFTTRGMPLHKLIKQWQGAQDGYSKGRERSFHFGSADHAVCGMISHLGPQLAIANGVALSHKLKNQPKVALAFTGEGGTSEGDFHEALNVAAVWDLPVIFIIENNGYGLSTPIKEQFRCESLVDKAKGYGMEGISIDGNNILEVYDTIKGIRAYCIENQKPYLVECRTFRMRGHEEASGVKYVPRELFEYWEKKDPIKTYEQFLLDEGVLTTDEVNNIKNELAQKITQEVATGFEPSAFRIDTGAELNDVYAPVTSTGLNQRSAIPVENAPELRFIDAIKQGLRQCLQQNDDLVIMGQDIAAYGGAFKITEGFAQEFGTDRIRNTPICESAIVGAALGLSLKGQPAVVEMQFADFVSVAFNQIVNNLAKIYYRWGQPANVVIRMPTGAGVGAGPFHSQSNEAWFTHTPGLKVVYPSTPADAKGLLIAAVNDPNPVLFFEHKLLYRSISGNVPEEVYEVPIGKARVVKTGAEVAIITYGAAVHWAETYAAAHPEYDIYILDLRTLQPLDMPAIEAAVAATGRVLIFHEDTLTGGIGGEIAAWIGEHCFTLLDAPVMRCCALDTPIPFNIELEKNFLPSSQLHEKMTALMKF